MKYVTNEPKYKKRIPVGKIICLWGFSFSVYIYLVSGRAIPFP